MNKSKISIAETQTIDNGGLRLPNTNLNQAKLKLILKQLKKMDNSIWLDKNIFNSCDQNV